MVESGRWRTLVCLVSPVSVCPATAIANLGELKELEMVPGRRTVYWAQCFSHCDRFRPLVAMALTLCETAM